jgi:hypothetical protein
MQIVCKDKNTVTVQWICDRLGLDNILGKSFLDQLSHNTWIKLTEEQKSGLNHAMGVQDNTDGNLIVQQLTPFRAEIRFRDSSISPVFLNFAKATVSIQNDFLKYQKEFEKVMCGALLGLKDIQATYEGAERVDDGEQFTDGNDGGFGKEHHGGFEKELGLRRSKRSKPGDTGEKKISDLEGSGTDRPGAKRQCNEGTRPIPRKKGKNLSHLAQQKKIGTHHSYYKRSSKRKRIENIEKTKGDGCNAMCELNAPDIVLGTDSILPHSATFKEMNCSMANMFNTFKLLGLNTVVEKFPLVDLTNFKSVMEKLHKSGRRVIKLDREHDF